MCNVIGYNPKNNFERIFLGGVSYYDAQAFIYKYKGIYTDIHGYSWYLQISDIY